MYEIIFHKNKNGENEVEQYIRSLKDRKDKDGKIKYEKISGYLEALSERGLDIGMPSIKYLKNGIWELRPLKDRILFGYVENNKFIILSRFVKKTRKTPIREIIYAQKLLKDYKEGIKSEKKKGE